MALWNEKPTPGPAPTGRKEPLTPVPGGAPPAAPAPVVERPAPSERVSADAAVAEAPRRPAPRGEGGESVIAANLTIEGKIEGSGNVRMAGRFKGDVRIDGNRILVMLADLARIGQPNATELVSQAHTAP